MTTLRYQVVDVFTDRPYAGNPLAVVFDADGLAADRMRAVAREFNLSETTFVLPPVAGGSYRVRIFTPAAELPFAGHPSVGTAATLVRSGALGAGELIQECGAGNLPITASADRALLTGGTPHLGPDLDPTPLLATIGLTPTDLAGPADLAGEADLASAGGEVGAAAVVPRLTGCGIDSVHLLVRPDAVARAVVDAAALRATGQTLSVSAWDPATRVSHSRVFAPDLGVPEDPATGSAALAHGVFLVAAGLLPPDGESAYTIHQGIEMGRPSTLDCTVTATAGRATRATVAGGVVPVAAGEITV
jgi:trans-2,3-dihydro-3-hydroxyanthranilate isomerase